jgi:hypothetical protein
LRSWRRRFDIYEGAGELQRITIVRSIPSDTSRDGFVGEQPHGIK